MRRERTARKQREPFGRIRRLPSGRYQAAYIGPDLALHKAAATFDALLDARAWLTDERRLIDAGAWSPLEARNVVAERKRPPTLSEYAWPWLGQRVKGNGEPLKPRTRQLYGRILEQKILPTFGDVEIPDITPVMIRSWLADPTLWRMLVSKPGQAPRYQPVPTRKAHSYALLHAILATAVIEDEIVPANPCHVKAGGSTKRARPIRPASLDELTTLVQSLPERHRMLVLLAVWCTPRWGELTELRRSDIDFKHGKLRVSRGVVVVDGETIVDDPKSAGSIRDVAIPPHLIPALRDHVNRFTGSGPDGLVFPAPQTGEQLAHGAFFKIYDAARKAAGRPDLRFHDLRHTGAVLAAQSGATLAELMYRLGHKTPSMALRYQHAAQDRDAEIARRLSVLAEQ